MIFEKLLQHVFLSFSALFLAIAFAIPFGMALTRWKRGQLVVRAFCLLQTMPGLAMLAFIVVILAWLSPIVAIPSTGVVPGVLTLFLYAISPILTSTYTGLMHASPMMVDVATGLGMTERQILMNVKVPSAIPMILAGVRIAGVWTIGMATLASLVGSGGLGDIILQGLRSMNPSQILIGTIPAACLALVFEWGMHGVEKWLQGLSS